VPRYDVIVIGGGINGAAIAAEAALSGFSVALFERDDLCSGTSSASTRLIHGGLRYLEHAELGLVYESLHERERLLATAGHLLEPIPFYIPVYAGARRRRWQIAVGMSLYDVLSIGKSSPRHRMLSAAQMRHVLPGLREAGLRGGACYYDAQVTYPERLVIELCIDAAAHGAEIRTHSPVEQIIIEGGEALGVEYRDGDTLRRAAAAVIVNAAGPWVDRVAGGHARRRLIGGTRGSHLVVAPVNGMPSAAVYLEAESDGRPFFVIPWNGLHLIGTTDVRFDGDPAEVAITSSERQYLLSETRRVLPAAGPFEHQVCYSFAGIRALPYRPQGSAGSITRKHLVHAHAHARGLYSVIGGKLTTHRSLAVDVLRCARRRLPRRIPRSPTRNRRLPGMLDRVERTELEAELTALFDARLARRLLGVYGALAARLIALAKESPEYAMVLGPSSDVLVAELLLAFDSQWAANLVDFLQRRCMSGLAADRGLDDAEDAARWLVRLGRLDAEQAHSQVDAYRSWLRRHRSRLNDR